MGLPGCYTKVPRCEAGLMVPLQLKASLDLWESLTFHDGKGVLPGFESWPGMCESCQ